MGKWRIRVGGGGRKWKDPLLLRTQSSQHTAIAVVGSAWPCSSVQGEGGSLPLFQFRQGLLLSLFLERGRGWGEKWSPPPSSRGWKKKALVGYGGGGGPRGRREREEGGMSLAAFAASSSSFGGSSALWSPRDGDERKKEGRKKASGVVVPSPPTAPAAKNRI